MRPTLAGRPGPVKDGGCGAAGGLRGLWADGRTVWSPPLAKSAPGAFAVGIVDDVRPGSADTESA